MRTYVLSTQFVLRDQLRILSVRKCADFHENRLIYAYLSTREHTEREVAYFGNPCCNSAMV